MSIFPLLPFLAEAHITVDLLQPASKMVSWLPAFPTCNPFPILLFVIWLLPLSPDLSPATSSLSSQSYTLQPYRTAYVSLNGPHLCTSHCTLSLKCCLSMSFALQTFVLLDLVRYCHPSGVFHRISLTFVWDPYHSVCTFYCCTFSSVLFSEM